MFFSKCLWLCLFGFLKKSEIITKTALFFCVNLAATKRHSVTSSTDSYDELAAGSLFNHNYLKDGGYEVLFL